MKSPSQNERILALLDSGREWEMRDIHREVGFCRLNSRVSELRKRGHVIECRREGNLYFYRLVKPEPVHECWVDESAGLAEVTLRPDTPFIPTNPEFPGVPFPLTDSVDESAGVSEQLELGGIPVKTDESVEPGTVELRDGETVVAKIALSDAVPENMRCVKCGADLRPTPAELEAVVRFGNPLRRTPCLKTASGLHRVAKVELALPDSVAAHLYRDMAGTPL